MYHVSWKWMEGDLSLPSEMVRGSRKASMRASWRR